MRTIRIGSRESRLAVVQSELVQKYLESQGVQAPIVTMKTTGDKDTGPDIGSGGWQGLVCQWSWTPHFSTVEVISRSQPEGCARWR